MVKIDEKDLVMSVSVYDRRSGQVVAEKSQTLGTLTDDNVQVVASGLAHGLIEDLWEVVSSDK